MADWEVGEDEPDTTPVPGTCPVCLTDRPDPHATWCTEGEK